MRVALLGLPRRIGRVIDQRIELAANGTQATQQRKVLYRRYRAARRPEDVGDVGRHTARDPRSSRVTDWRRSRKCEEIDGPQHTAQADDSTGSN